MALEPQVLEGDGIYSVGTGPGGIDENVGEGGPYMIYVNNVNELPTDGSIRLAVLRTTEDGVGGILTMQKFYVWDDVLLAWRELLSKYEFDQWITNSFSSVLNRLTALESSSNQVLLTFNSVDYPANSFTHVNTPGLLIEIDAYTDDINRQRLNLEVSYSISMQNITVSWLTDKPIKIYLKVNS